jgi:hypothetical protein
MPDIGYWLLVDRSRPFPSCASRCRSRTPYCMYANRRFLNRSRTCLLHVMFRHLSLMRKTFPGTMTCAKQLLLRSMMRKGRLGTAYCAISAPQFEATMRTSRNRGSQADDPIVEKPLADLERTPRPAGTSSAFSPCNGDLLSGTG